MCRNHIALSLLLLILLSGCHSAAYRTQYAHLQTTLCCRPEMQESDYFLIVLVNARHLDYTRGYGLLSSIAKHPDDWSKTGDVGHAWIYLQGIMEGQRVYIEGGHSGELGIVQPKYFDGVMNYIDYGYVDPKQANNSRRYEPNPVKYLWAAQDDGYFQEGSGGHCPTFAAKVNLTPEQFQCILRFIQPENYPYHEYALTGYQCSSFVTQVAALADFSLDYELTIPIEQVITFRGRQLCLWQDPQYAAFRFSSPDILEKSLMEAVRCGRAEYALEWYEKRLNHRDHREHRENIYWKQSAVDAQNTL